MRNSILILAAALALAGCVSPDSGGGPAGPPGQAEFQAGVLYSNGRRLPGHYVKAARWYHEAAVLGHARAQGQLGFMYQTGQGVGRYGCSSHVAEAGSECPVLANSGHSTT